MLTTDQACDRLDRCLSVLDATHEACLVELDGVCLVVIEPDAETYPSAATSCPGSVDDRGAVVVVVAIPDLPPFLPAEAKAAVRRMQAEGNVPAVLFADGDGYAVAALGRGPADDV